MKDLTLPHPCYSNIVEHFVWGAYLCDSAKGDITTDVFLKGGKMRATAVIIAKESGILAGMQEALWFLKKLGLKVHFSAKDGAKLKKGTRVFEFSGPAFKILAAERTLLNLLQRMSGIATATNRLVSAAPRTVKVLATRKTFWSDLDKRAVVVGGGYPHRLNLSEAILVKDNHWFFCKEPEKALQEVLAAAPKLKFTEVEVKNTRELSAVLRAYDAFEPKKVLKNKFVVMLDNFTPVRIRAALPALKKRGILVEVSGGITEKNVKQFALPGVNFVSSGAITNKAPALDLSLDFLS
jgi:nicotinate-nucleotide pyrophosphorylase (carboxylating)